MFQPQHRGLGLGAQFRDVEVSSGFGTKPLVPARKARQDRILVVQKYGGSSIADVDGIGRVARHVAETYEAGDQVVVVVSAMGDTTDGLLDLASRVSSSPDPLDLDLLLATGEVVSMMLLAIALADLGVGARTFTGGMAGLFTDNVHGKAHLVGVEPRRIKSCLLRGEVAIVAGFQGRSLQQNEVTTLGRGGSDLTGVALAAALDAAVCEIYTDVDGIYTADPRIVPRAQKIDEISSDQMLELAASGANILQLRCVEYARRFGLPIRVRSSFSEHTGTLIRAPRASRHARTRAAAQEVPLISAITADDGVAQITLTGVRSGAAAAAGILEVLDEDGSASDMLVQKTSVEGVGMTDISFDLPRGDMAIVSATLAGRRQDIGFHAINCNSAVAKVSLNGVGMRSTPMIFPVLFTSLSDSGIEPEIIAISDICIDVLVGADQLEEAVAKLTEAFHVGYTPRRKPHPKPGNLAALLQGLERPFRSPERRDIP
jgi:aspartate kinase